MKFYKETDFKKTFVAEVPKEWEIVRLNDVLLILRNGLTIRQNKEKSGYPITRIETISEERIDISKLGYVDPSNLKEKEIREYKVLVGDILFSHINSLEHIGKTAIYEGTPAFLLHGMNLLLLRPNKNKIHPRYLLYLLRLFREKKIFWTIAKKAVNQASINQTELGKLKIFLPPLEEQKAIAYVLSTVDEAVQKVDEAISRVERLKKGLMQTLLTRGIGHKEFKETEIGKIPKEWKIVRLQDVTKLISTGSTPSTKNTKYYQGNIPFIKTSEINNNIIYEANVYISEAALKDYNLKIYPPGTILLAMYGQGKTRGKVSLLKIAATISQNAAGIVLDTTLCNPYYIWYFLMNKYKELRRTGIHGHISHLNLNFVKNFKIILPPLSEQEKIVNVFKTVDRVIDFKIKKRARLKHMKKHLMDLLLTGKVRVSL